MQNNLWHYTLVFAALMFSFALGVVFVALCGAVLK